MKNKLEPLLNILIQRGWKPYWIDKDDIEVCSYEKNRKSVSIWYMNWVSPSEWNYDWLFMSLRELVSKESWLWQFVCENKLTNKDKDNIKKWIHQFRSYVYDEDCWIENNNLYNDDYEYYIIESSLKDESELEDFLLSNIKVEW